MTDTTLAATRARVLASIPVESVIDDREAHADRIARIAFTARRHPRRRPAELERLAGTIADSLHDVLRLAAAR